MGEDPLDITEILERTKARDHRVFAGRLERQHVSVPQKIALTLVRGLEGDFRDWAEIEEWAAGIAGVLQQTGTGPEGSR